MTSVPRIGDGTEVRESHLAATTATRSDESEGSQFDGNAETTTGQITFLAEDGLDHIEIDGVSLRPGQLPQTVRSDETGTLLVTSVTFDSATGTGTVTYTYTLNDNTLNGDGTSLTFPITVVDTDGDTAEDELVINIIDDVPTAYENTNSVSEGGTASGNVLIDEQPDEFGADGPGDTAPAGGVIGVRPADGNTSAEATGGTGTEIHGQFGTLTLNADGTYTYVADANTIDADSSDVFVYTIEDADGDRSTTTLTITISDVGGSASDNDVIVDESGLDGIGSQIVPDGEFFTGGQITVTGASGPFTYELTGSGDGTYGTLVLNSATGAFTYTLDTPFDEPDDNNGRDTITDAESFEYRVIDQFGNVVGTGSIDVDIVDDVPQAQPDFDTVAEGGSTSGDVSPNDVPGADGDAGVLGVRAENGDAVTPVTTGIGTQIRGEFGVLVLNADGTYTYHADADIADGDIEDVFVYTMSDGDGDWSTTTLTITVTDVTGTVTDNDALVDESGLDGIGSQIVPNGEFFTGGQISVAGATGPFTYTLLDPGNGTYGTLDLNTDTGSYTYTLDTPFDEPDNNNGRDTITGAESFDYEVRDANGNLIGGGTIVVDIRDDVPIAQPDSNFAEVGATVFGNVLENDVYGADRPGALIGVRAADGDTISDVTGGIGTTIAGVYGTLTLGEDGSYQYTAIGRVPPGVAADIFVYTIRDADGDLDTTTLTIRFANNPVPVAGTVNATLDDDALPGGLPGDNGDGSDASPDTSGLSGTLPNATQGDLPLAYSLSTSGAPTGYEYVSPAAGVLEIRHVGTDTTVITVTLNTATGAYTIVQNAAVIHPDGDSENNIVFTVGYGITDANGDFAVPPGQLIINVDDDTPVVEVAAGGSALVADESVGTGGSVQDEGGTANNDETAPLAAAGAIGYATGSLVSLTTFAAGADGEASRGFVLSVTSSASGLTDTASDEAVVLSMNGTVVEGRTATGGDLVFTLAVDATTGAGTLNQFRAVVHDDTADHDENGASAAMLTAGTIALTATLTDTDGDSASQTIDVSALVAFEDDGPLLGAFTGVTVVNAVDATGAGTFVYDPGSDEHGSFAITGPALPGITYATTQNPSGALLTATSDANETIFTLQVNTDGTYTFTLVTPEAATTESVSLLNLSAGGPAPFVETPDFSVEFSGSGNGINSSTQGFGVDNQFVGNGESFTIEFHDPGAAGDQAANVNPEMVSSIVLQNDSINGSLGITVTVFNDVLNTSEVVYTNFSVTGASTLIDPIMPEFNRVLVEGVSGTGQGVRFTTLDITRTVLPSDINLSFNITATDGDGDITSTSSLAVFVDATTPVVVDLDGDGAEFLGVSAGTTFDYFGTGNPLATAWAGPDDAILAIDFNGNGRVDTGAEIVFGANGMTDLERIAATYDSNADGVLDASDAAFGMFGVWQDANSDGVTDAGEFLTLSEAGIVSISLESDGVTRTAGDGDVLIHGEAAFVRSDGSSGIVADASFAVGRERSETRSLEFANTAIAASVIASALLVDQADANNADAFGPLDTGEGDTQRQFAPTLAPVAEIRDDASADLLPETGGNADPTPAASHAIDASDAVPASISQILDHYTGEASGAVGSSADERGEPGFDGVQQFGGLDMAALQHTAAIPLGWSSASTADAQGLSVVSEAIDEAAAEHFVDHLVDALAGNASPPQGPGETTDIAALLWSNVGNDTASAVSAFDFNQTMEDLQAASAA